MIVTQSTFIFGGNNLRNKSYDAQAFFDLWWILYYLTSIFQHFLTSNCTSKRGMTVKTVGGVDYTNAIP